MYRRLLEKSQVYERQLAELQVGGASGEGEVEEVLTPGERERVDTVKRIIAKRVNCCNEICQGLITGGVTPGTHTAMHACTV